MRLRPAQAVAPHLAALTLAAVIQLQPSLPAHPLTFDRPVQHVAAIELSDEQELVVDAWSIVSKGFYLPDYGGVDWKGSRSEFVKRKYKSMKDAQGGVSEMLGLLNDRYTRYLSPSRYKALTARFESSAGEGGIGVELRPRLASSTSRAGIEISMVSPGSPADGAGLHVGDLLVEVDGQKLPLGASAEEGAALILGPLGRATKMSIERETETLTFSLQRTALRSGEVELITSKLGDGRSVAVLSLRTFSEVRGGAGTGTLPSLERALNMAPVKAAEVLLFDLRSNPGGHFPTAVDAARLLLPTDATIVATQDRTGSRVPFATTAAGTSFRAPAQRDVYVLVNRGTASAAEVFAAALRDNGVAQTVGETSFGKGLVQSIQKTRDGGAVVCTVARYLTPSGADINGVGVPADLPARCDPLSDAITCVDEALRASK